MPLCNRERKTHKRFRWLHAFYLDQSCNFKVIFQTLLRILNSVEIKHDPLDTRRKFKLRKTFRRRLEFKYCANLFITEKLGLNTYLGYTLLQNSISKFHPALWFSFFPVSFLNSKYWKVKQFSGLCWDVLTVSVLILWECLSNFPTKIFFHVIFAF